MILVFILLTIIIFLLIFAILILFSTFKLKIRNLEVKNKESKYDSRIKKNYEIILGFYILEKIPILWIKLNNKKIKKVSNYKPFKKMNIKKIENRVPAKETINLLKNIKIEKLNLKIKIGTEDVILTSYLVAIIGSLIGILLPHIVKESEKYCIYKIIPKYRNKNEYYICLNGIFCIKIVHIIYIVCIKEKKGRDKNERTSNRRAYA